MNRSNLPLSAKTFIASLLCTIMTPEAGAWPSFSLGNYPIPSLSFDYHDPKTQMGTLAVTFVTAVGLWRYWWAHRQIAALPKERDLLNGASKGLAAIVKALKDKTKKLKKQAEKLQRENNALTEEIQTSRQANAAVEEWGSRILTENSINAIELEKCKQANTVLEERVGTLSNTNDQRENIVNNVINLLQTRNAENALLTQQNTLLQTDLEGAQQQIRGKEKEHQAIMLQKDSIIAATKDTIYELDQFKSTVGKSKKRLVQLLNASKARETRLKEEWARLEQANREQDEKHEKEKLHLTKDRDMWKQQCDRWHTKWNTLDQSVRYLNISTEGPTTQRALRQIVRNQADTLKAVSKTVPTLDPTSQQAIQVRQEKRMRELEETIQTMQLQQFPLSTTVPSLSSLDITNPPGSPLVWIQETT